MSEEAHLRHRYHFDVGRSRLVFRGRSPLHEIHARAGHVSGWVELTSNNPLLDSVWAAEGALEVLTDTIRTGHRLRDRELHRLLDVRHSPLLSARLERVQRDRRNHRFQAEGVVHCRGRSVQLGGRLEIRPQDSGVLHVVGTVPVELADFDIHPPKLFGMSVDPHILVSFVGFAVARKVPVL